MKCNQDTNENCNNLDMKKCDVCQYPRLCLCARIHVQTKLRKRILEEDKHNEKNSK